VVLQAQPSSFVQNYYNFLLQISTSVSQQINTITINSIQYGSATVNFIVSTTNAPGSSGANTQQTNLQNTIGTNNTVGGMRVASSSLVLNGAPSDNSSSNNQTVLIIAIVVPIASLSTFLFI
jgi:hypothetical protein